MQQHDSAEEDDMTCFIHPCVLQALTDSYHASAGDARSSSDTNISDIQQNFVAVLTAKAVNANAAKGLVDSLVVRLMTSQYASGTYGKVAVV